MPEVDFPKSEGIYRELFARAPDGMLLVDSAGVIQLSNPKASELFGYPKAAFDGMSVDELVPEISRSRHATLRAGFLSEPRMRPMGSDLSLSALCSIWPQASSLPPPQLTFRQHASIGFDTARGRIVLTGGTFSPNALFETWEWDGVAWTQAASMPGFGIDAPMAFDQARGQMLYYGQTQLGSLPQLWRWTGSTWNAIPTPMVPNLNSYQRNKLSIDPNGLPLDARIEQTSQVVSPMLRGGIDVRFDVKKELPSAIVILHGADGKDIPSGSTGVVDGSKDTFIVGHDGRAYISGLKADNTVVVTVAGKECRASFAFAAKEGTQSVVGPVTCQ